MYLFLLLIELPSGQPHPPTQPEVEILVSAKKRVVLFLASYPLEAIGMAFGDVIFGRRVYVRSPRSGFLC